jgi:hypothetical protein
MRRRYTLGTCQDCGHTKRVTRITFWVNGMRYVVCSTCIRPYRGVILKPCAPNCPKCAERAA